MIYRKEPMADQVYVILFNARTNNEGIHTLRVGDRDVVLMFEDEDDATRFGLMLEAQDFPPSSVEAMSAEDIEYFCEQAGYEATRVPTGELVTPPDSNVDVTDWQEDAEPAPSDRPSAEFASEELDRIRRQLEGLL